MADCNREYGKSKDKVVEGQFGDIVENLIRTNGENEATFGHIQRKID